MRSHYDDRTQVFCTVGMVLMVVFAGLTLLAAPYDPVFEAMRAAHVASVFLTIGVVCLVLGWLQARSVRAADAWLEIEAATAAKTELVPLKIEEPV
jgi:hypothetical protein